MSAFTEGLVSADRIRVVLPASYNHALFRALHPGADVAAAGRLDVTGGAEVLADAARVEGLTAVARLVAPVREAGLHVALSSPPVLEHSRPASPAD